MRTKCFDVSVKTKYVYPFFMIACVISAGLVAFPFAFAVDTTALEKALTTIVKLAAVICLIVGPVYLVSGIVKYAQARADVNGKEEKAATTTITTAIVLIIVGIAFSSGGSFISEIVANTINNITT